MRNETKQFLQVYKRRRSYALDSRQAIQLAVVAQRIHAVDGLLGGLAPLAVEEGAAVGLVVDVAVDHAELRPLFAEVVQEDVDGDGACPGLPRKDLLEIDHQHAAG
jgi:hypothetical protein